MSHPRRLKAHRAKTRSSHDRRGLDPSRTLLRRPLGNHREEATNEIADSIPLPQVIPLPRAARIPELRRRLLLRAMRQLPAIRPNLQ